MSAARSRFVRAYQQQRKKNSLSTKNSGFPPHHEQEMSAMKCSSSSKRDDDRTRPPEDDVVLVSRSTDLAGELSILGVRVVLTTNITDIPEALRLRCIIFDPEFAQVSDLSWIRRAYPTGTENHPHSQDNSPYRPLYLCISQHTHSSTYILSSPFTP